MQKISLKLKSKNHLLSFFQLRNQIMTPQQPNHNASTLNILKLTMGQTLMVCQAGFGLQSQYLRTLVSGVLPMSPIACIHLSLWSKMTEECNKKCHILFTNITDTLNWVMYAKTIVNKMKQIVQMLCWLHIIICRGDALTAQQK